MDITLVRSTAPRKRNNLVVFNLEGRRGSVQFLKTLFEKDAIPSTLTLSGTFAPPKVKLTAEERKAARKALPKLTPQEKLQKMEQRLAKMRAKLQASPAPTTAVPTNTTAKVAAPKGKK